MYFIVKKKTWKKQILQQIKSIIITGNNYINTSCIAQQFAKLS